MSKTAHGKIQNGPQLHPNSLSLN